MCNPLLRQTARRTHSLARTAKGFTLVELLVVIGIIALLISVLLPVLGKARESANTVACLSNIRQLGQAALIMASEKKGQLPPASDKKWAMSQDPGQSKYSYRVNPGGGTNDLLDWASHLLPYMGARGSNDFNSAPAAQSRIFVCPSDQVTQNWNNGSSPGFTLFNNVTTPTQRISYGINIDITANVDATTGEGRFGLSDNMLVYQADAAGNVVTTARLSPPLNGKLNRVRNPSATLLFADAGTFPPGSGTPLDLPQVLVYTTNYIGTYTYPQWTNYFNANPKAKYTLAGIARTDWLRKRLPLDRHGKAGSSIRANNDNPDFAKVRGGKINVAFADGHGETVGFDDFIRVNVSPYSPR